MSIFDFWGNTSDTGKQKIDRNLRKEMKRLEKELRDSRSAQNSLQEARILEQIGFTHFENRLFDQSIENWQDALRVYQDINERKSMAEVYSNIGSAYRMRGDLKQATRFYNKALIIDRDVNPGEKELYSLHNLAGTWLELGEFQEALEAMTVACEISDEINHLQWRALSYYRLGLAQLARNQYRDAYRVFDQALKLATDLQDLDTMTRSIFGLAQCYECSGEYGQVPACYQDALEGAASLQDPILMGLIYVYYSRFNINLGLLDQARDLAKRAFEICTEESPSAFKLELELLRSRIYAIQGMWEKAFTMLDESEHLAAGKPDSLQLAKTYLMRIEFQLENGHFESAMSTLRQLSGKFPDAKNVAVDFEVSFLMGQIYRGLKMNDEALQARETSIRKAESLGNPRMLWRAYHALGRFYHHQQHYDLAKENYQIALRWIEYVSMTLDSSVRQLFLHTKERLQVFQDHVLLLLTTGNKDLATRILKKLGSETLIRKVQHFL